MGPEIAATSDHWMGDWPPRSFGHFGMSGSLLLLNVDEGIGVVATTTEAFGPWARSLWPRWTSAARARSRSVRESRTSRGSDSISTDRWSRSATR